MASRSRGLLIVAGRRALRTRLTKFQQAPGTQYLMETNEAIWPDSLLLLLRECVCCVRLFVFANLLTRSARRGSPVALAVQLWLSHVIRIGSLHSYLIKTSARTHSIGYLVAPSETNYLLTAIVACRPTTPERHHRSFCQGCGGFVSFFGRVRDPGSKALHSSGVMDLLTSLTARG